MVDAGWFERGEIERVERERAAGVTTGDVVRLFASKGVRLSAATFRKYVQAGLLPRSRRVGRKGKHAGSTGLYPVAVVRRIDLIKRMMAAGLTLDDIRESYAVLRHRVEDLGASFSQLQGDLSERAAAHPRRRLAQRELAAAAREGRAALERLERVAALLARRRDDELMS
jgi:DNA-binding transcriptional MerR regulator